MAMSVVYTSFGLELVSECRSAVNSDYLPDTLGSTAALIDNTQTVTDSWTYWPFGELKARLGTNQTPFSFVGIIGYFCDIVDRLVYVRFRHYLPNRGQWLTLDPLAFSVIETKRYAYVDGRPLDRWDIFGLTTCEEEQRRCERDCTIKAVACAALIVAAAAACAVMVGIICAVPFNWIACGLAIAGCLAAVGAVVALCMKLNLDCVHGCDIDCDNCHIQNPPGSPGNPVPTNPSPTPSPQPPLTHGGGTLI